MSKVVTVQVHNLSRLIAKVNKLATPPDLTKAMQDCTQKVTREAKTSLTVHNAVVTGNLRRSIKPYVQRVDDNTIGVVYTNVEYAPYVHFGRKKKDGSLSKTTPFFTEAMAKSQRYISERIELAVLQSNKKKIN